MQIAGVELGVRHPVMVVGATEWIPAELAIGDNAAVGDDTHVVVRVRPGADLVKVRLFDEQGAGNPAPGTVFDGVLALSNGRLVVGDGMGDSRFVQYLGKAGRWHVRVAVDDAEGFAGTVDVTVRPSDA